MTHKSHAIIPTEAQEADQMQHPSMTVSLNKLGKEESTSM